MSQIICKDHLDFLTHEQKSKLSKKFRASNRKVMPHELAVSAELKLTQALAVLLVLETLDLCNNYLLIYHTCEEVAVGRIPFGQGFPNLPWTCSECNKVIENYDEMRFDLLALALEPIEFL